MSGGGRGGSLEWSSVVHSHYHALIQAWHQVVCRGRGHVCHSTGLLQGWLTRLIRPAATNMHPLMSRPPRQRIEEVAMAASDTIVNKGLQVPNWIP